MDKKTDKEISAGAKNLAAWKAERSPYEATLKHEMYSAYKRARYTQVFTG